LLQRAFDVQFDSRRRLIHKLVGEIVGGERRLTVRDRADRRHRRPEENQKDCGKDVPKGAFHVELLVRL
jgi:hypothetical protein